MQDYAHLLHTAKANQTRLKTATEFARSDQDSTLVRHALYAVWRATETGEVAESLTWLRTELPDYWHQDATAATLVAGTVENDHV